MITQTGIVDDGRSAVSWKAILAGATASIAISLVLIAFGAGVGFSVVSPWSDQGISSTTFTIGAGIYLIVIAMLSSTIGGYLAGRLRSQWQTVHESERYFRDSAHGVVTWALATIITAAVLGSATTAIIGATGAGLAAGGSTAARSAMTDGYVDGLLRPATNRAAAGTQSQTQANQQATDTATSPIATGQATANLQGGTISAPPTQNGNVNRDEIGRILATGLGRTGAVSEIDKSYLASVIAARTGLTQQEAEQRVNQTITQAKAAADAARKSARNFAFWMAFAMLAGALSAALAAIEGGNLRNREWYLTDAERNRARTVGIAAE